tara:strand:- start:446 stop:943 length:498 start_codon:yes stop_codon:yes gene_type:complete
MAVLFRDFRLKIFEYLPLILLFIVAFNGISVIDFKLFSINLHYIVVYYWVLRKPQILGYGFIFLSGLISDVIFGLPLGATPLSLLTIASVASYVRVVTVNISLLNDWVSFIPALLFSNFVFFVTLYFSDYSINYLYLFKNSIFTFIFYPVLWIIFSLILRLIDNK